MDPIYSVGSVIWKGQRRFVEYHGGSGGDGLARFHATDALTGMSLRIPYERVSELGWKRMPAEQWAAATGLRPPKAESNMIADPWWIQRERDPIVRFCDQYLESHRTLARDGVTGWTMKIAGRDDGFVDAQWLVRSASGWSWSVAQGARLADLLMDLFAHRVWMAFVEDVPADFDWSKALEGSGYGEFARALLGAAAEFESDQVPMGPPEQLGLFG